MRGSREVGFGGGVVLIFERLCSFEVELAGLVRILRLRGCFCVRAGQRRGDGRDDHTTSADLRRRFIDVAGGCGILCHGIEKREKVCGADFGFVLHELLEGVVAGGYGDGGQAVGARGGDVRRGVADDADGGVRTGLRSDRARASARRGRSFPSAAA